MNRVSRQRHKSSSSLPSGVSRCCGIWGSGAAKTPKHALALERQRRIAAESRQAASKPAVTLAHYRDWLPRQPIADLLLTGPPYATDAPDIVSFVRDWLPLALSRLKPTGRAYVCVGAYPEEIGAYLAVPTGHFKLAQILVWTYRNTIGPSTTHIYKLNWQAVLYFIGPEVPPLDCDNLTELFSVQDISAPDARHNGRFHEWEKPIELALRFIRHSTQPGQLVIDPFVCTGTFVLAASRLGHIGQGCDLSAEHLEIAHERGCEYV